MTEMANALRQIQNLPLVVMQFPTNKWGFVGTVPAPLTTTWMGSNVTQTFETSEDAIAAASAHGFTVNQIVGR